MLLNLDLNIFDTSMCVVTIHDTNGVILVPDHL